MAKIVDKIQGVQVEPPINNAESVIELNFDTNDPHSEGIVSTNLYEWSRAPAGSGLNGGAVIINAYRAAGLTGGVGVFEGLPFTRDITDDNGTINVYNGYLDLASTATEFLCDNVNTTSRLRGGNDWLTDRAGSVSYPLLFVRGKITIADQVQIPYIISSIPNFREAAIMTLTAFVVIGQIRDMIKELGKVIADIGSITSAIAGIIKIVVLVIHFTLVIVALIKLIKDIKNALIQPIKYHNGMRLERLLEIGANELGMTFESTIFNNQNIKDTVIIPAKNETFDNKNGKLGFRFLRGNLKPVNDQRFFYLGTFEDLLRICLDAFNARLIVANNVIKMEIVNFNPSAAKYELPDVERLTESINAFELTANYKIGFITDSTDSNTIDEFTGTVAEIITEPRAILNKDMVLMQGDRTVSIPFALVKIKKELTSIGKLFKILANIVAPLVNGVIAIINGVIRIRNNIIAKIKKFLKRLKTIGIKIPFNPRPTPPLPAFNPDKIDNRIGMWKISNDFFTKPKIGSFDIANRAEQTKPKSNNSAIWRARTLWDNYHFVNSFVPTLSRPNANQWLRYSAIVADFCKEDFLKVLNNNFIFTPKNGVGKLESLKWNIEAESAEVEWRENVLYTANLKETIIESDGEQ